MILNKNTSGVILLLLLLIVSILGGCSKDIAYLIIENQPFSDSLMKDSGAIYYRITSLPCSIQSHKKYSFNDKCKTDSITYKPIDKDCFVNFFVYKNKEEPTDKKWIYFSVYQALKVGVIYPIYNYIQLRSGVYTFYALSTDLSESNLIPNVNPLTGLSEYIYNGETYYWWKNDSVLIDSLVSPMSIIFKPMTVKLKFQFIVEDQDLHTLVLTAPSTANSKLSLNSGMISTSRELTDSICSNIVDNESQIEIVPLITYESLKLKIKYKQGNEEKMLNKEIIRPIGNLFQGGYEYSYVIDLVKDTLIAQ